MTYEDYISDALQVVSAWEIPEEDFAQVVNDQARLMAGQCLEPSGSECLRNTLPYPHH